MLKRLFHSKRSLSTSQLHRMVDELAEANRKLLNRENELRKSQFFQGVFNQVLTALIAATDVKAGLGEALEILCPAVEAEVGVLYLIEEGTPVPAATWQVDGEPPRFPPGRGFPGVAVRERRQVVTSDIPADFPVKICRGPSLEVQPSVVLAQPVMRGDTVLGVLLAGASEPFRAEQLDLVERAMVQAGLAVTHSLALRRAMGMARELKFKSEALKRKYLELEEAGRTKSLLFAGVSHELNTPLNSIIGFSRVLLKKTHGGLSPSQEEYVKLILKNGEHLLSVIQDILEFSRNDADLSSLPLEDINLTGDIEECVRSMQPQAGKRSQRVTVHSGNEMPRIRTNRLKLRQVLFNLLSNAVKFSPEGSSIDIRTKLNEYGDEVCVTVADQGPGIPEEDRERIFEPFIRASQTSSTEGTGLGLALTRSLVQRLGGRLWVDAAPGGGSEFSFTLPVAGFAAEHGGHGLVKVRRNGDA